MFVTQVATGFYFTYKAVFNQQVCIIFINLRAVFVAYGQRKLPLYRQTTFSPSVCKSIFIDFLKMALTAELVDCETSLPYCITEPKNSFTVVVIG